MKNSEKIIIKNISIAAVFFLAGFVVGGFAWSPNHLNGNHGLQQEQSTDSSQIQQEPTDSEGDELPDNMAEGVVESVDSDNLIFILIITNPETHKDEKAEVRLSESTTFKNLELEVSGYDIVGRDVSTISFEEIKEGDHVLVEMNYIPDNFSSELDAENITKITEKD